MPATFSTPPSTPAHASNPPNATSASGRPAAIHAWPSVSAAHEQPAPVRGRPGFELGMPEARAGGRDPRPSGRGGSARRGRPSRAQRHVVAGDHEAAAHRQPDMLATGRAGGPPTSLRRQDRREGRGVQAAVEVVEQDHRRGRDQERRQRLRISSSSRLIVVAAIGAPPCTMDTTLMSSPAPVRGVGLLTTNSGHAAGHQLPHQRGEQQREGVRAIGVGDETGNRPSSSTQSASRAAAIVRGRGRRRRRGGIVSAGRRREVEPAGRIEARGREQAAVRREDGHADEPLQVGAGRALGTASRSAASASGGNAGFFCAGPPAAGGGPPDEARDRGEVVAHVVLGASPPLRAAVPSRRPRATRGRRRRGTRAAACSRPRSRPMRPRPSSSSPRLPVSISGRPSSATRPRRRRAGRPPAQAVNVARSASVITLCAMSPSSSSGSGRSQRSRLTRSSSARMRGSFHAFAFNERP